MVKKVCCWCKMEGEEEEMNYISSEYSHMECDIKYAKNRIVED